MPVTTIPTLLRRRFNTAALFALLVALVAVQSGCSSPAETEPTPDLQATVAAAVKAAVPTESPTNEPDNTTKPTATLIPPTDTPVPPTVTVPATALPTPTISPEPTKNGERLQEVDCGPDCEWDHAPVVGYVKWIRKPEISPNGELTLTARIDDDHALILPGEYGGASNITLTDGGSTLYGIVLPPSQPGWDWDPAPGQWIATQYEYRNKTLSLKASIDPAAATHKGLTLCLWTGSNGPQNYILACTVVGRH